jgi:hypothetical protein
VEISLYVIVVPLRKINLNRFRAIVVATWNSVIVV